MGRDAAAARHGPSFDKLRMKFEKLRMMSWRARIDFSSASRALMRERLASPGPMACFQERRNM